MTPGRSTTHRLPEQPPPLTPLVRLRGWVQAAHPFPLLMVLSLTALAGVASARGAFAVGKLGLILLAMLLSQLAIGWTNDYVDRESDARFQPWKPVPAGVVPARLLLPAIAIVTLVSFALGAVLGPLPMLFLAIGTGAGLAYDLVLKDSRLSWLPYVVAFSVLPPFVWSGLDVFRDEFLWLYLVGLPLTLAAHLANTLPDIKQDAEAGRRSVAVLLGRGRALWVLAATLVAPAALLAVTLVWVTYDQPVLLGTLAVYVLLLTCAAVAYGRGSRERDVWAFRFVVTAAVLLAVGWLAAV